MITSFYAHPCSLTFIHIHVHIISSHSHHMCDISRVPPRPLTRVCHSFTGEAHACREGARGALAPPPRAVSSWSREAPGGRGTPPGIEVPMTPCTPTLMGGLSGTPPGTPKSTEKPPRGTPLIGIPLAEGETSSGGGEANAKTPQEGGPSPPPGGHRIYVREWQKRHLQYLGVRWT